MFPNLTKDNYKITSPDTKDYNCIAWAYGINNKTMWPGYLDRYWPADCESTDELSTIIQLYLNDGYIRCENSDLEYGYQKVAIYATSEGPKHAARQLPSGKWTSKIGQREDIQHDDLQALDGQEYGKPVIFLKKALIR